MQNKQRRDLYENQSLDVQIPMQIQTRQIWDLRHLTWRKVSGSINTDGAYLKTELDYEGALYYLKLSNYDVERGIFGHESVNELIAARVGRLLGFETPDGFLRNAIVNVEGVEYTSYVFASKSFKQSGSSRSAFEDYYAMYRQSKDESSFDFCKRMGWESYIYKMFIFDYLIINRDRHGANLEVIKNGGIKLSPLFDNGLSLVCSVTDPNSVDRFDPVLPRSANNFIGAKGENALEDNLESIDMPVQFNELLLEHKTVLFKDLDGVLAQVYFDKIWEILVRRWERVKTFRVA